MEDLRKVSSLQMYTFWKNLSVGLLIVIAVIAFSLLLPYYFSPIIALVAAAGLYTMLYNNRINDNATCMVVVYAIFICMISYSFMSIILNVLYIWGIIWMPAEFTFFSHPYIPSLTLIPLCFLTFLIVYIRRHRLSICVDCKISNGDITERGKIGRILEYESDFQLKNLLFVFGTLSVVTWLYYLCFYVDVDINARDRYVFVWLDIIAFVLDELYFIFRYYNLYLDLKENDEIITQEELDDMSAKTYLRFYVVCGNDVYLDSDITDPKIEYRTVIDTPFFTKRSVSGISVPEVHSIIRKMSGVKDGELKFFFGRKQTDLARHSVLRYFYFLDGTKEDYPELNVSGKWFSFDEVKRIYSYNPGEMSSILVSDMTRLATVILTQKVFDEDGFRKNKIKAYKPTFDLQEIRKGNYDLQSEKWIRISMFNSDTPLYRFKRWWRGMRGGGNKNTREWN